MKKAPASINTRELTKEKEKPAGAFVLTAGVAEKVGFEPTVPCDITGFQDQLLKPLGHLSIIKVGS